MTTVSVWSGCSAQISAERKASGAATGNIWVSDYTNPGHLLRIDAATLRIYVQDIPRFELGGKLLFRRKAIEEWIARRETSLSLQVGEIWVDRRPLADAGAKGGASWKLSGKN